MAPPKTIDEVLLAEIKQDLAERYFGFRKLIEEDEMDLAEKTRQYSFILQKRISFDLIRIYIMLKDEKLIRAFLVLINLNDMLFYDPYLTESLTIAQRVLECQRFRGLTRAARFRHFFLDCYENLVFHAQLYGKKIAQLREAQGVITAEIEQFHKQHDMRAIMSFLHSLGNEAAKGLQGGMETGLTEGLDQKLRLTPPPPIEALLPILPPLPPLAKIKGALKEMSRLAYTRHPPAFLAIFEQKETPCPVERR